MRRLPVFVLLLIGLPVAAPAQDLRLPNQQGSLKFAVIGDAGQPGSGQTAIAKQMVAWRARFPFEFVVMMGDNLYGTERPRDYQKKFEIPYKPLLDAGVKFYASLGNHDDDDQTKYKLFNMDGRKYYVEIVGDEMYFQAINGKGVTIDAGRVRRPPAGTSTRR